MKLFYLITYYFVLAWHYFVVFCFIYGFFAVWQYSFWIINAYIALCLVIARTQQQCELTALENFLARKIGAPAHNNFIKYWMFRPLKKFVDTHGDKIKIMKAFKGKSNGDC